VRCQRDERFQFAVPLPQSARQQSEEKQMTKPLSRPTVRAGQLAKVVAGTFFAIACASIQAQSVGMVTGTQISQVVTQAANAVGQARFCVYVTAGPIPSTPSCNTYFRMCGDVASSIGRAQLATALTAQTTARKVELRGKGTCTVANNSEDLDYILLMP
jgi:hypothetical protein